MEFCVSPRRLAVLAHITKMKKSVNDTYQEDDNITELVEEMQ